MPLPYRTAAVSKASTRALDAWFSLSPLQRAESLTEMANALERGTGELAPIAAAETSLSIDRLTGEIARTADYARYIAGLSADGRYLHASIDPVAPSRVAGAHPDMRRMLVPVGPVLNFAASNFPFSFSVFGGDTVAALAAGCSVIVKAHPGHPRTSDATAAILRSALVDCDRPADVLQLVHGEDAVDLLTHGELGAACFTGSLGGGVALSRIAAARDRPIPFYAEMGSVNPVFIFPRAAERMGDGFARELVDVAMWSAGQVCTKPGVVLAPRAAVDVEALNDAVAAVDAPALLHDGIADGFRARVSRVAMTLGLQTGDDDTADEAATTVEPVVFTTDTETLATRRDELAEEIFGPATIVAAYPEEADLIDAAETWTAGSLTAAIFFEEDDDLDAVRRVASALVRRVGRILFNQWTTTMSFSEIQQHGGPWPATSIDTANSTSVGPAGIARFQRAVVWQNAPDGVLPDALRTSNPLGVQREQLF